MANRGNVHQLLKSKEEIEYLVTLHTHRYANMPLPKQLEKKFWCLNLDRTRQNISKFLASGVLTYLIFIGPADRLFSDWGTLYYFGLYSLLT